MGLPLMSARIEHAGNAFVRSAKELDGIQRRIEHARSLRLIFFD